MGLALSSALIEVHHLPDQLLKSIEVVGGKALLEMINNLKGLNPSTLYEQLALKRDPCLRRLSLVKDPELKTRIIAILDY